MDALKTTLAGEEPPEVEDNGIPITLGEASILQAGQLGTLEWLTIYAPSPGVT